MVSRLIPRIAPTRSPWVEVAGLRAQVAGAGVGAEDLGSGAGVGARLRSGTRARLARGRRWRRCRSRGRRGRRHGLRRRLGIGLDLGQRHCPIARPDEAYPLHRRGDRYLHVPRHLQPAMEEPAAAQGCGRAAARWQARSRCRTRSGAAGSRGRRIAISPPPCARAEKHGGRRARHRDDRPVSGGIRAGPKQARAGRKGEIERVLQ